MNSLPGMLTLVMLPIILGIGIVTVMRLALRARRGEALQTAGAGMKFTFQSMADAGLVDRLKHFHLFSHGRRKKIINVLQGRAGDIDVSVFDYRYVTGGGQQSRRWNQTVILFEADEIQLPSFTLRPENLFHKIGQVFGYKDIDFDSHPEFSKRYLLRGENESEVRHTFSADTVRFYESDRKLSTEAAGRQLTHYRAAKLVPPNEISRIHQARRASVDAAASVGLPS